MAQGKSRNWPCGFDQYLTCTIGPLIGSWCRNSELRWLYCIT